MPQSVTHQRGRLRIVCDAFLMTNGKFAPIYKVFEGEHPVPIQRQDFPSRGPDFHTPAQATEAAGKMADDWITKNKLE